MVFEGHYPHCSTKVEGRYLHSSGGVGAITRYIIASMATITSKMCRICGMSPSKDVKECIKMYLILIVLLLKCKRYIDMTHFKLN